MNVSYPPPVSDRHHNQPPLPERIILEFDEGLASREVNVIQLMDEIEARAEAFGECQSEHDVGAFGETIKTCQEIVRDVEAEREIHNRPLLLAQRALKGRADQITDRAKQIEHRLRTTMNAWLAEQKRLRDLEEARLAEIARKAEEERQRLIREAEAKAAAEAEAERQRLQAIADAEAEAERQRLQAIEDERAAAEQREAAPVVVEAQKVEVEPEPVFVPPPPTAFVTPAPPRGPIRGDYGAAVSVVTTWDVRVKNVRQVPDAYLKHPTVIEALEKVIRPLVRGKNGLREIKGCEVFSTTGSSVR